MASDKAPQVSVVMAVYNGEKHLTAAVDSTLAQTLTDFEFIIIDDGSTDGTAQILADYAAKDDRIVVIRGTRAGLAASLNIGIERARSELIARMDADDRSLPRRLEVQNLFMETHPDVDVLGTAYREISDDGTHLTTRRPPTKPEALHRRIRLHGAIHHPTVMYRKSRILALGGYREADWQAEDLDLWLRGLEAGVTFRNLPDVLFEYRVPGQVSRTEKQQDPTGNDRHAWTNYARLLSNYRRTGLDPGPSAYRDDITLPQARYAVVSDPKFQEVSIKFKAQTDLLSSSDLDYLAAKVGGTSRPEIAEDLFSACYYVGLYFLKHRKPFSALRWLARAHSMEGHLLRSLLVGELSARGVSMDTTKKRTLRLLATKARRITISHLRTRSDKQEVVHA